MMTLLVSMSSNLNETKGQSKPFEGSQLDKL